MNRRDFLMKAGLAGLALPFAAMAQTAPATSPGLPASRSGTVLVEIINFHCPRCRAINDYASRLKQAAIAAGLDFRVTPITWENQSLWPDRVYYAARDLFPGSEELVREFLFDGIQREGMRFEDVAQVMAYLVRRELPKQLAQSHPALSLSAIAEYAATDAPLISEMKVGRLLDMTLAQDVPVFAWVREGAVLQSLSPANSAEPLGLVRAVMDALAKPAA